MSASPCLFPCKIYGSELLKPCYVTDGEYYYADCVVYNSLTSVDSLPAENT